MANKTPYNDIDARVDNLKKDNEVLFNRCRLRLMTVDKINLLSVKSEVNKLYKGILNNVINEYYASCKKLYPKTKKKDIRGDLDELYLVTGYRFYDEWDRKCTRYFENLLVLISNGYTLKDFEVLNAQKRALHLLNSQIEEYGIFVTDQTLKRKFEDEEVDFVVWVCENDNKVCAECLKRDGVVYPLEEIPDKTHYGCRCYIEEE